MRLNPLHPSDNPMYQQLYCFGGGSDTGGGSAGDFDDSYNQAMGYTDTLGGPGRSDDSGNARQTTAEERAAAPGYDSRIDQALDAGYTVDEIAQSSEFQGLTGGTLGAAGPGLGFYADPASSPTYPDVSNQGTFDPRISSGVMSDSRQQFDLEQMQLANDLIARSTAAANRTPVTLDRPMQKDREGYFSPSEYETDIDIFDTAFTGGATPAADVTSAAGVEQARSVAPGSPQAYEDMTGAAPTPKSAADLGFVQDTTPRTKEEKAMAEDRGYFNYQDLNKDGTVTDLENLLSSQAFGLVGRASDIGRRMNIGPTNADGTAAIPGRDFDYKRTDSGAIDPRDPNYMGPNTLDYEGDAYGTPDSIFSQDGGDGGSAVAAPMAAAPVADPCPEGYKLNPQTNSCEYVGVVFPGATGNQLAPITQTTQYTGVAGLEPFVLRPSYTAPTSFSPTYNFG